MMKINIHANRSAPVGISGLSTIRSQAFIHPNWCEVDLRIHGNDWVMRVVEPQERPAWSFSTSDGSFTSLLSLPMGLAKLPSCLAARPLNHCPRYAQQPGAPMDPATRARSLAALRLSPRHDAFMFPSALKPTDLQLEARWERWECPGRGRCRVFFLFLCGLWGLWVWVKIPGSPNWWTSC